MKWIDKIKEQNFNESFDIKNILIDSVYYPASGIDGRAIRGLSNYSNSFIHVDYSEKKETVENALRSDFIKVGYRLMGLKHISRYELTPKNIITHDFHLMESEQERINFLKNSIQNLTPFALWAVYELDSSLTHKTSNKVKRFSLLHIGGEACATFDALYVSNKMNPLAIAILNPGEGYGDNWTSFRETDYRFYKLIKYNVHNNDTNFPKYLLTNMCGESDCFWPDYNHKSSDYFTGDLYEINKNDL